MDKIIDILIDNDVKGFDVYHTFNNQKAAAEIDWVKDPKKLSGFVEGFWAWGEYPSIGDYIVATKGIRISGKNYREVYAVFKVIGDSEYIMYADTQKALKYIAIARGNGRSYDMEPNDKLASGGRYWTPLELIVAIDPGGNHFPDAKADDPFYEVALKLVGEIFTSKSMNPCGKFNLK